MPAVIKSNADILNLPFYVSGTVVGVGDPSQPPAYDIGQAKQNNRFNTYVQDTWHVSSKLTVNYGLAWSFESTLVNGDLTKPAYLAPLYGNDLSATNNNYKDFSPSVGFAYSPFNDKKTVIRGGLRRVLQHDQPVASAYRSARTSDRKATAAYSIRSRASPTFSRALSMSRRNSRSPLGRLYRRDYSP